MQDETKRPYRKPNLIVMLSQVPDFEKYKSDELIKRDDEDVIITLMSQGKRPVRVEFADRQLFYVFLKADVEAIMTAITLNHVISVSNINDVFSAYRTWKSNIISMKKTIEM